MDTSRIVLPSRRKRRQHAPEFRQRVVQACRQGGVSIAAVALANGLNANMVRKWVSEAEALDKTMPVASAEAPIAANKEVAGSLPMHFLPLAVSAEIASKPSDEIRIELQRGPTTIKVTWPTAAAPDCAAWLRELLR